MNPAANISPAPVESLAMIGRDVILHRLPLSITKHPSFPNLTAAIFAICPNEFAAAFISFVSNKIDNSAWLAKTTSASSSIKVKNASLYRWTANGSATSKITFILFSFAIESACLIADFWESVSHMYPVK